ncbi:type III secretion system export apparatus subunit SctT [Bradyrhizobium sp. 160]|uniref:type III secretion system export apparatus subunit SctT n=1 Tax=Bradyrhizobium sp. 160 TaxID=2782634 RepID=UPI001FFA2A2F|nr:type III secretion system export apparatus subunit SctT [Bradyrhizobium sp. 160]MCK1627337.1 type III secretion system export apparatus subunit SctT [Bradyrhizobium sp. 160]
MSPLDRDHLHTFLVVLALAMARLTGMVLVMPFLGRGMVTAPARNGVIMALALPVMGFAWATRPADPDITRLVPVLGLGLKELLLGCLLGMPVAATMWGVETAGTFIDHQRGATMTSLLSPASVNLDSPLGTFLAHLYATWLFVSGGFSKLLEALYRSHDVWPLWSFHPAFGPIFVTSVLDLADLVMLLTLLLAGPAIVAMFLSELGLALISRFAPQLEVFFLAMSVKSAVGLLLLLLSLTIIVANADKHMPSSVLILNRIAR